MPPKTLTAHGRTRTYKEWMARTGLTYQHIDGRLRMGWSPERIVDTPAHQPPTYTVNGDTRTLTEWAEHLGIRRNVMAQRILNGWDPARAITQPPH